jgi:hypothetical protein
MKRLSILVLVLAFIFTFSFGALADVIWTDNAGNDPMTDEGWLIDAGTLEGWSDSNFETLEYNLTGKSQVVGTGITVEGIQVDWTYPGSAFIGKGEDLAGGDTRLDQSIDYTVVAFAEIPCVLEMDIIGNGGWNNSNGEVALLNEENDIPEGDFMVFSPSVGGIVDAEWNFMEMNSVEYATGQGAEAYIHACDLWTANIWANVPYGFAVSSVGMSDFAGLEEPLLIEMRYLERLGNGIVSQQSDLPPFDMEVADGNWSDNYVLDEDGEEIGQYNAGQNSHINMQFRVPLNGAPAGRYQGEVTFSTYTI